MCSSKILLLLFPVAFNFFTSAYFHLAGRNLISHFLTAAMTFSCFSCNEIRLLKSLSLALSPLST